MKLKMCIEYELDGKKINYLPAAVEDQLKIKPIYKTFPGWKTSTNGIKDMEALPENAKKYIFAVEEFIGAKVSSVSTSPERDDTILVENPFDI
jgi:adenylosuccinate synthase